MRLTSFIAVKVFGYLDIAFDVHSDLTFLYGINGAGKTTAVRAIIALLKPDLVWLGSTRFDRLELRLEHGGKSVSIVAQSDEDLVEISYNEGHSAGLRTTLGRRELQLLQAEEGSDLTAEHYELFETVVRSHRNTDAISRIRALPTPLFLGLDRTTLITPMDERELRRSLNTRNRNDINSRTHLELSLRAAERLAKRAFDYYRSNRDRLAAQLRKDITLSLFRVNATEQGLFFGAAIPGDLSHIRTMRADATSSLKALGFSEEEIESSVGVFFDSTEETFAKLSAAVKADSRVKAEKNNRFQLMVEWTKRAASIPYIEQIVRLFEEFRFNELQYLEPLRNYETRINSFFADSAKSIEFSDTGNLELRVPNGGRSDLQNMSSGEKQIFVVLTQLAFNDDATQAKVLIIDEPELSLHVKWQDEFVDALLNAGSGTQIILATHSPAIIGSRIDQSVPIHAPSLHS